MNRGKSSYVNQSSMRVNNLPVRSLTVFEENIVVTVLLSKVYIRFFFYALAKLPVSSYDKYS